MEAVKQILDHLPSNPTSSELETMASYILYGKDENGLNAVQRGEVSNGSTRYASYRRKVDENESLDAMLDNPMVQQHELKPLTSRNIYLKKKPSIQRPTYNPDGSIKNPGDSDIPGMVELWESIDYLSRVIAVSEGLVTPNEKDTIVGNPYHLYILKHELIDLRRNQYFLKDGYKPTFRFLNPDHPSTQYNNWSSDSAYWLPTAEWERRSRASLLPRPPVREDRTNPATGAPETKWIVRRQIFNWENQSHVRAFIKHYSTLYQLLHEKLYTDGCFLLYDFEFYMKLANLSESRLFILDKVRLGYSLSQVVTALEKQFNISYTENYLSFILNTELPKKITSAAYRRRLIVETPKSEQKVCRTCGRSLPNTPTFFTRDINRKDGLATRCKECDKALRIKGGKQKAHDRRIKDAALYTL